LDGREDDRAAALPSRSEPSRRPSPGEALPMESTVGVATADIAGVERLDVELDASRARVGADLGRDGVG
jgi:hypothetical protein